MTRRRWTWVIFGVVAVAAALGGWRWRAARRQPAVRVETARVESGRIVAKVTATGTLSALVTVQVGSQVSGRVQALYADFNSVVRKGEVIARIDPQLFEAAVDQARANHVAALGNLAKARAQALDADRQYARNKALAAEKLIARADLDTAEANAAVAAAQVKAAQGTVEQARAALHSAQVNLAYTTIVSPTNGVVISRSVDVGQTVAASLQAPTLFVIAEDLSKMQVDTSVAESDVGRLQPSMDVTFTVDAYPSEVFRGRVRQIRNAPQTVQNVVTYDAVVDVDNPEQKLKPGMTANVTFVYAQKDGVLRVPNAALRFRPPPELLSKVGQKGVVPARAGEGSTGSAPGGARPAGARRPDASSPAPRDERTVWVAGPGGPAPVQVRTGISDGSFSEVLEGALAEGDEVVTDASGGAKGSTSGAPAGMRRPF